MKTRRGNRRGIALLLALLLLTLLGILTAGAVSTTAVRFRAARASLLAAALDAAAENAIGTAVRDLTAQTNALADLPYGAAIAMAIPQNAQAGLEPISATVTVTRLAHGLLWMVARARASDTLAGERRLNVVLRYPWIGELPPAAIVARGGVQLDPTVVVDADVGGDPDCARRAPSLASVQRSDSAAFYLSAFQRDLLDSAPGVTHVAGDTIVAGGSFDGILVVDGRLTVTGSWTVAGLVVARGAVQANALFLTGALLSFADGAQPAITLTGGQLRYSPCTVARAFRRVLRPRIARPRGWAEMF